MKESAVNTSMLEGHERGPHFERNRIARQRERAREQMTALLVNQKHRCHWCGEPIIDEVTIPADALLPSPDGGEWLVWKRVGKTNPLRRLRATIDHLVPIRDGGTNYWTNLVASCGPCNRKRTPVRSPKTMDERWTCPKCGTRKDDYRRRSCATCRLGNRVAAVEGEEA